MKTSRAQFKYALRIAKRNEETARADVLARDLQWAQKKSLHHINQENIYTKVMFKVIYCKN